VGLAAAYHLLKDGAVVTVIDRDPDGDKASYGNAGGIAVTEIFPASAPAGLMWRAIRWMLDPLGPLAIRPAHAAKLVPWLIRFAQSGTPQEIIRISAALSAINERVYDDLLPMLEDMGMSAQLHRDGALTVYETEEGFQRDGAEWARKRALGIVMEEFTGGEARQMEPALGPRTQRAMFTPQWSHISDPKDLVRGMKEWLGGQGVTIIGGLVQDVKPDLRMALSLELSGGKRISADRVVVAAGAWSGQLCQRLGDRVLLESERGYNTTLPDSGISLGRQLIFAERKFVATPLRCGLRIGGAAEFGGLKAAPNFKRSRALVALAQRYLPQLRADNGTVWAGHRPATPDSLPVIGPSRHANIFYAFGHGHLGLTQAATTGRLITEMIFQKPSSIDMTPYSVGRFS
jgi:D-amino-acid dehydrogenase